MFETEASWHPPASSDRRPACTSQPIVETPVPPDRSSGLVYETQDFLALYAELEVNSGDTLTLSALADWYEDNEQAKKAECVHWLAEMGKVPFHYTPQADIIHHFAGWKDGWYWWATARERRGWGYPKACRLPRTLWGRMKHTFDYDPAVFKEYPTVRGAIEAVIAAWTRRPPKAPKKKAV